MPIQDSQLKWRLPGSVSDASTNGGRMSLLGTTIANNVKNNVWPDVPSAERLGGSSKYRKIFLHVSSENYTALNLSKFFMQNPTPGGAFAVIFPGTQDNTQGQLTGAERKYSVGTLVSTVASGVTSIDVYVGTTIYPFAVFQNGDTIRISDMVDVNSTEGHQEFVTVSTVTGSGGTTYTITFNPALGFGYSATNSATKVGSCIVAGDIKSSTTGYSYVGSGGSFNSVTYPIQVDHRSGIRQVWTITFTSSTAFTLSGDTLGSMGGGTITSDLAPVNATVGYGDGFPYFTLNKLGWAGTNTGHVFTFTTTPASYGIWEKRIIPANCPVFASEEINVGFEGESA